jgi:hypothetical protein
MDLAHFLLVLSTLAADVTRLASAKVRSFTPVAAYLSAKLTRTRNRFEALFLKWQTGWRPTPRAYVFSGGRPASPKTTPTLPSKKGWYADALGADAIQIQPFNRDLTEFLHNPVMQEFLKDVPQAGRLLRPVAAMFHIPEPEALKRQPNPFPRRAYRPRPRKPAPPPPQPPQYATVQDSFIPTIDQIARPGTLRWMILKSQGGN